MSENKSSRQLLAALLQQAGREGLGADDLSGMFAELTSGAFPLDQDFEVIADGDVHGAMTDGSKRRMVDEASGTTEIKIKPKPALSFHLPSMPVDPKRLPDGIPSLEKWSKCCLEFGRYGGDDLTYADLVGSKAPEHQSYVKWAKDNPKKSKDPRFTDLVEFLKLYEEMVSAKNPGGCFPGSTIARNFKD